MVSLAEKKATKPTNQPSKQPACNRNYQSIDQISYGIVWRSAFSSHFIYLFSSSVDCFACVGLNGAHCLRRLFVIFVERNFILLFKQSSFHFFFALDKRISAVPWNWWQTITWLCFFLSVISIHFKIDTSWNATKSLNFIIWSCSWTQRQLLIDSRSCVICYCVECKNVLTFANCWLKLCISADLTGIFDIFAWNKSDWPKRLG